MLNALLQRLGPSARESDFVAKAASAFDAMIARAGRMPPALSA